MRIELPTTSWADAHRAQDDAHTLTLPSHRPLSLSLAESLLAASTEEGATVQVDVPALQHPVLTLTL